MAVRNKSATYFPLALVGDLAFLGIVRIYNIEQSYS